MLFWIQYVSVLVNMKGHDSLVCAFIGNEMNFSYVIPWCCRTGLNSICSDKTTVHKNVVNSL